MNTGSDIAYIAVHGGAGSHGTVYEKEVKRALRKACVNGLAVIRNAAVSQNFSSSQADANGSAVRSTAVPVATGSGSGSARAGTAIDMVAEAIVVLEDDEHLNAGYGSNLTLDGTVECDAAIINGRDAAFGSVGAVSGVKNPIRLAKSILEYALLPRQFGRVPPLTLTSSGAHAFASSSSSKYIHDPTNRMQRIETVPPESLISPSALGQWRKWRERLEGAVGALAAGRGGGEGEGAGEGEGGGDGEGEGEGEEDSESMRDIQDTVGAVAYHPMEGVAAGVSSGGLLLKWPGRIGEAGIFGAGCWANQAGVACSVSGTGEHIIRENLARKLCDAFVGDEEDEEVDPHEILDRVLRDFWDACQSRGEEEPAVGVVLLVCSRGAGEPLRGSSARVWCAFTTASMAIGYASSEDAKPKAVILRHPGGGGRAEGKVEIYITSIGLQ